MPISKWELAAGALISHAINLKKGKDAKYYLGRAKDRLIELEIELGTSAEEKKIEMNLTQAFLQVYNKLPFGVFSGTKVAKQAIFLTGRTDAHKDSVLRKMRQLREDGTINCVNIDAPMKSLYEKRPL
jgi:hypothetical protein